MQVRWYDSLPTTMDVAHALAQEGAAHGTVVAAREQTAARGRRGRTWLAPRGGLWMSVICRPAESSGMEHLSLRIGLAVAEVLERLVPAIGRVQVKWPNDLLLDGRKLAGILCEARWEGDRLGWVIAAIGLNVANRIPDELAGQATSLARHASVPAPGELAQPIAEAIAGAALTPGPLSESERERLALREAVR
jgi:BirA family biotin operon repressor/biotin-[acetyl-CoA-carboxylase] ligase